MTTSSDEPISADRLKEIADELYFLGREGDAFTARARVGSMSQVPAVFAIGRHAVELGMAAVDLHMSGKGLVSLTLTRAALESTITALWLVQSQEAVLGLVVEANRNRRNLVRQMGESSTAIFREGADRTWMPEGRDIETIAAPQARHFEAMCNALRGGKDAYLHYRILSGMVHPSATAADFYLEQNDDSPAGCIMHEEPRPVGHNSWLYLTVACMVWASLAIDHLDIDHVHRSRLRQIARELEIPQTLELTPEAEQEVRLAQQARRRAARARSDT